MSVPIGDRLAERGEVGGVVLSPLVAEAGPLVSLRVHGEGVLLSLLEVRDLIVELREVSAVAEARFDRRLD